MASARRGTRAASRAAVRAVARGLFSSRWRGHGRRWCVGWKTCVVVERGRARLHSVRLVRIR